MFFKNSLNKKEREKTEKSNKNEYIDYLIERIRKEWKKTILAEENELAKQVNYIKDQYWPNQTLNPKDREKMISIQQKRQIILEYKIKYEIKTVIS